MDRSVPGLLIFAAVACLVLSLSAGWAERRRRRRRDLDRVGWVPWTTLSFWFLLGAVLIAAYIAGSTA